jgi:hypothetical protein
VTNESPTKWETISADGGRELTRETTHDGETIACEVMDRVPSVSLRRELPPRTCLTPEHGVMRCSPREKIPFCASQRTAKSTIRCFGLCRVLFLVRRARWTLACVRLVKRPGRKSPSKTGIAAQLVKAKYSQTCFQLLRRAIIASTVEARRAGIYVANIATASMAAGTMK